MQGIEGYRLVRRIGAGGMGTVHEALDADGRRVAVKVLHEAIAADPAARERLRREVELLHRVRGRGVARVLDAEADAATAFVVTELIDGPTLEDDVREHGPLTEDELAELAHGLAEGLDAIHAAGIAHRDLKPGNVMLSADGPVIIDFGIAQVADDVRLTQTGMVTGTPGYLDPDVLAGGDPGPAGDWWAWAAVLTYAATGRPPFGRGGMQAVLGRVSTGVVDTDGLPDRLAAVLGAALDPEPARRLPPGDVLAALDGDWDRPALRALLASPPDPVTRTDVLPPSVPPAHTRALPAQEPWYPPPVVAQTYEAPAVEPWDRQAPEQWAPQPVAGTAVAPAGWGLTPQEVPPWAVPPRRRGGTLAALGLGLTALAMLAPGAWAVGVLALVVVLGAVGRGAVRLRTGRLRRGLRRGDTARAWLAAPVHLLGAALATVPGLLLAALVAGVGGWAVLTFTSPPADVRPWLLWCAAALALWALWSVPPAEGTREGARVVLGALPRQARVGLVLLGLGTAAVLATLVLTGAPPDPVWSPLPSPA
ncbi:serine/threonine protein kinase [Georgenia sp. 311]|uniref:serine/threonine-protein kinase n=1 Tax=Georgenia sp. 311 TaxID=2585134 RepID=UPI00111215B4|nr:serine/threonine-protein kinase [Georgenia sp. 311]TNC17584.1 serine/threonine protein kinase [Georgenia sp. 311]